MSEEIDPRNIITHKTKPNVFIDCEICHEHHRIITMEIQDSNTIDLGTKCQMVQDQLVMVRLECNSKLRPEMRYYDDELLK